MTNYVTVPGSLGGTGKTFSDGTDANGMQGPDGYGYKANLVPMLTDVVAASNTALNSANSLVNTAGGAQWVTGTTYGLGATVWSPSTFQTFRKKTASSVSSVDPASDGTNWTQVSQGGTSLAAPSGSSLVGNPLGGTLAEIRLNATNAGIGTSAGAALTSGVNNAFVGLRAGRFITTGNSNVAVGPDALRTQVTGDGNVAVGDSTLFNSNGAANNVAIGKSAGTAVTTWGDNVFIGQQAGAAFTAPGATETAGNVCIGTSAAKYLNTDGGNVAVGAYSVGGNGGSVLPTAYHAVGIGRMALGLLTQGNNNTAVGDAAGSQTTVGGSNAFFGRAAGNANTTGGFNVMVGHAAGFQFTTGGSNTFVGDGAGNAGGVGLPRTGSNNTAVGEGCGPLLAATQASITMGYNATTSIDFSTVIGRGQTAAYISGVLSYSVTNSAISNAAGVTLTAAQLLGGIIRRSGAAAVADTTPTAAQIVAAIPGCEVGSSAYLEILNTNTGTLTITAGAGVTLQGTTTIATVFTRRYLVNVTNATAASEAVTLLGISTAAN